MTDVKVQIIKTVNNATPPRKASVLKIAVPGPRGPKGDDGATLVGEGAHIYRGSGEPENTLGVNNEWYIDSDTADMYQKQDGAWVFILNIAGPEGPAGPPGQDGQILVGDGANILTGAGAPDDGNGTDGDLYLDTDTANVYKKISGSWVLQLNIRGSAGPAGLQGIQGNPGTNGTNGWSPVLAIVADGTRSVAQVQDWQGGTGTKPATGKYVGESGLVDDIEDAVDIRGPAGPAGAAGANGAPGAPGAPGADGQNGARWYAAAGAPDNGNGIDGDFYIDLTNGDVYQKAAGVWGSSVMNIIGPPGADGQTGSVIRAGSGAPDNGLGTDLDFYIDTASGDLYQRQSGSYSVILNIKGADGEDGRDGNKWFTGSGAPDNGVGEAGDLYLNIANGDVYQKDGSSWSSSAIANLKGADGTNGNDGEDGASIFVSAGAPDNGNGADGDIYINVSNGDLYQKVSGSWSLAGNLQGPAGSNGSDGEDGEDGAGLPEGGVAGDVLRKLSATNFDYEWVNDDRGLDTKTDDYVLELTDRDKILEMNAAGDKTFTIPPNSSVAFPVGSQIDLVRLGTGAVDVAPGSGVTLLSADDARNLRAQYSSATIYKRDTDTWLLLGDIELVE